MADVCGVSQAWKSVCSQIPHDFEYCASPEELQQLICRERGQRSQWLADAASLTAHRQVELQSCATELRKNISQVTAEAAKRVSAERAAIESRIHSLESATIAIIRWFNRWIRIPPLKLRVAWLTDEPNRASTGVLQELNRVANELHRVQSQPEVEVARIVHQWEQRLQKLEALVVSPEHAGAVAELEMTELLSRHLPDTYTVFNDVSIEMNEWFYVDGENRRSAQIDHIVVGPGGVCHRG